MSEAGFHESAQAMLISAYEAIDTVTTGKRPKRSAAHPAPSAPISCPKNAEEITRPI
jgi:hypothetical protein